jgi:hypothetical protein
MEHNLKSFILELDYTGKKGVKRIYIKINAFLFCFFHALA